MSEYKVTYKKVTTKEYDGFMFVIQKKTSIYFLGVRFAYYSDVDFHKKEEDALVALDIFKRYSDPDKKKIGGEKNE
jgi:hypothetical protein